ncbi:MAG: pyridoxine 5'-phosphate synthase [Calditerrivibrio sp.]|nr:pyridoxine 5'-phosphate synthase [Calditerrivibrio sp.]MCA1980550.1 pyridoxine 5'-phosphate synthase [Calditerrivibrio sp.]
MIRLGVNIDHIATIRQARRGIEPDPVHAAVLAELGGADGITVHLREDRRHIQDRDVFILRETVKVGLNLEMACNDEIVNIALRVKPDMCTLVPEKREELTTEGGLNVRDHFDTVARTVDILMNNGIDVSIFIDPDEFQIDKAYETGAKFIEIHTGKYADSYGKDEELSELKKIDIASRHAKEIGFVVNAGHGLNYKNVSKIASMTCFHEFNIGHSIVSRAVLVGMEEAVREMKSIMLNASIGDNKRW